MTILRYEELCGPTSDAAGLVRGNWKIAIFCAIQPGPMRLRQLVPLIPTASKKVTAENLRQFNAINFC